jgi:hypothetical protein
MLKAILVLGTLAVLAGCGSSGGRFAGLNTCAADGSVVLYEYPNADGSYDTLNTGPCKNH